MTGRQHKEEISLSATKGFMPLIKKFVPYVVGTLLIGGSGTIAKDLVDLESRVAVVEELVNDNSIELNGQAIELRNYSAKVVEIQTDIREQRADIKQILIILQKK